MTINRYKNLFTRLYGQKEIALIPFFCLGNPAPEVTKNLIYAAVESGADALELGFPFSDPVADGPLLQKANMVALKAGMNTQKCFTMLAEIRGKFPHIPIGLLLYANIVHAMGVETFYERCTSAGVDSVLLADVPMQESEYYRNIAMKNHIAPIFIVPPNSDEEALQDVVALTKGYTYVVARSGVTGVNKKAGSALQSIVRALVKLKAPPPCVGFGVSVPRDVENIVRIGAQGVIFGSAIAKIIDSYAVKEKQVLEKQTSQNLIEALGAYIVSMKAATRKA